MSTEPEVIIRLRALLDQGGAEYEIYRREDNVATAEDGVAQGFGALHNMAPTLILNCGDHFVAAIISGDRRLTYKLVKKHLDVRNLSLATPEQVREVTGADVGSVSLVNTGLRTLVDTRLVEGGTAFGGCGIPGYSLRIAATDLVRITGADVFDFTTPKTNPGSE